jgi:hypothetical protein
MAYLHLLPDLGMNYTLNRPLFDGKATSRITKVSAVAPQIEDFDKLLGTCFRGYDGGALADLFCDL